MSALITEAVALLESELARRTLEWQLRCSLLIINVANDNAPAGLSREMHEACLLQEELW